eukprot:snap_masked-scaffold_18-processed-gene-6.27-mRNA-1 protein AED:1.00 eAED:1.00 QI:0/0/0/0/1/1/2/0/71
MEAILLNSILTKILNTEPLTEKNEIIIKTQLIIILKVPEHIPEEKTRLADQRGGVQIGLQNVIQHNILNNW